MKSLKCLLGLLSIIWCINAIGVEPPEPEEDCDFVGCGEEWPNDDWRDQPYYEGDYYYVDENGYLVIALINGNEEVYGTVSYEEPCVCGDGAYRTASGENFGDWLQNNNQVP